MAQLPPDPNFTGAQKNAYTQQYGGYFSGSKYNPTGTAPAPVAAPKPAPIAAAAPATPVPNMGSVSSSSYTSGSPLAVQTATQPGAGGQTIQTQFRNALLGQLNTDPNNVSLTDPALAPQARAFEDAQTRSLANQQRELAEQAFAGGTRNTGAYSADLQALRQQQGEAISQNNASLIANEQQRRNQNLFNALGLGSGLITQGSAQGVQQGLGMADINLRNKLGTGQLGLGLLQAMLGDRQANNRLGLDAALGSMGFNQDAILAMMGGK